MKGTLCFWDRKGNSSDQVWVLVKKRKEGIIFLTIYTPNSWLAQLHLLRIRAAVVFSTTLSTVLYSLTPPSQVCWLTRLLVLVQLLRETVSHYPVLVVAPCAACSSF